MKRAFAVMVFAVLAAVISADTIQLEGEYLFTQVLGLKESEASFRIGSTQFAYLFKPDGTAERTIGTWAIYRWQYEDNVLTVGYERYLLGALEDGRFVALQAARYFSYDDFSEYSIYLVTERPSGK